MGAYDTLPTLPAGHVPTDVEFGQILALLNGSGVNGGLLDEQVYLRTSDQQVTSNTTLQNDAVFSIPLLANATYHIYGMMLYSTNATALMKGQWSTPAGAGGGWVPASYPNTVTSTGGGAIDLRVSGLTTQIQFGCASTNITGFMPAMNVITSTAGTLVWQFGQVTSTAVLTGMRAGSRLIVKRIA